MPIANKTAVSNKSNKRAARRLRKAKLEREMEEREGHSPSEAEEPVTPDEEHPSGSQPSEGAEVKEAGATATKPNPWTANTLPVQTPSKKVDKSVSHTLHTPSYSDQYNLPFRSFFSDRMDEGGVQEGQEGQEAC